MSKKISINLTDSEEHYKTMIQDLKQTQRQGNVYYNRSESEIAKMILVPALKEEHAKCLK